MHPFPDRPVRIAVIGERQTSSALEEAAETIGREIAGRRGILICGGMGGVMEAACRGAASAGGVVVGILPTDGAEDANPYVTIPLPTGLGEGRNILVVRGAEAVIAVGGGYGTLSELGHALKIGLPVIGLDTWEISRAGLPPARIRRTRDPLEAVEWAWQDATARRNV
ncbi:MAG: TIGR00725 family protein [bacterium]